MLTHTIQQLCNEMNQRLRDWADLPEGIEDNRAHEYLETVKFNHPEAVKIQWVPRSTWWEGRKLENPDHGFIIW